MSDPLAKDSVPEPVGDEEEEYESDVYEVDEEDDDEFGEENENGDVGDGEDDIEDDSEDEEDAEQGQSLTALLVQDPLNGLGDDAEDNDEGFAPPGEVDPADLPIDGTARELIGEAAVDTEEAISAFMADPDAAHRVKSITTLEAPSGATAVGMKRKTSADEGEEDDVVAEESETKRVKA